MTTPRKDQTIITIHLDAEEMAFLHRLAAKDHEAPEDWVQSWVKAGLKMLRAVEPGEEDNGH